MFMSFDWNLSLIIDKRYLNKNGLNGGIVMVIYAKIAYLLITLFLIAVKKRNIYAIYFCSATLKVCWITKKMWWGSNEFKLANDSFWLCSDFAGRL